MLQRYYCIAQQCHYSLRSVGITIINSTFQEADNFAIWNCTRVKLYIQIAIPLPFKIRQVPNQIDRFCSRLTIQLCLKCFLGTLKHSFALSIINKNILTDAMFASLTHTTQNLWRQFRDYFCNLQAYTNSATSDSGQMYFIESLFVQLENT